jgi:hypothetical protein
MKLLQDLKDLPNLRQRLADAEAKVEGYAELEKALEASLAESKELGVKLTAESAKVVALEAEKTNLSAEFEAYKAKEGERNAAYAAANIAGVAVAPVSTKAKETAAEKPDLSKLTGIEKAVAAHKIKTGAK